MGHDGKERRRHRVYVTRNTEYHVRDGVCVGVRDRRTGRFQPAHIALGLVIESGVRSGATGAVVPTLHLPCVGEAIFFLDRAPDGHERQIVTSRIVQIDRPPRSALGAYR